MITKKAVKIHTLEAIHKIIKEGIIQGWVCWSDGSCDIHMFMDSNFYEISMNVWEELNLRYNLYEI